MSAVTRKRRSLIATSHSTLCLEMHHTGTVVTAAYCVRPGRIRSEVLILPRNLPLVRNRGRSVRVRSLYTTSV